MDAAQATATSLPPPAGDRAKKPLRWLWVAAICGCVIIVGSLLKFMQSAPAPEEAQVASDATLSQEPRDGGEVDASETDSGELAPVDAEDDSPQHPDQRNARGIVVLQDPADGASKAADGFERSFAIIFGIDSYSQQSGLSDLLFAENDARAIRDVLWSDFGYSQEATLYLANEQATQRNLRHAFEKWLPMKSPTGRDSILVFFAGHGLISPETNQGYFAACDSLSDDLVKTCIPVAWIRDRLAALPTRHKLVILDSCYSGSLFSQEPVTDETPANPSPSADAGDGRGRGGAPAESEHNLQYYYRHPAFFGLSAGRFTPVADGLGENRHSVFTSALLKVLRDRADSPRADHAFTFRSVAQQVETRVANALGSRQIPDWGRLGKGRGDFVFREVRHRSTPQERSRLSNYAKILGETYHAWTQGSSYPAEEFRSVAADLRGWEWYLLNNLLRPQIQEYGGHRQSVTDFDLTGDGKRGVSVSGNELHVWDTETLETINTVTVAADGEVRRVAAGPHGNRYAIMLKDTVEIWNLNEGHRIRAFVPDVVEVFRQDREEGLKYEWSVVSLALGPDGRRVSAGFRSWNAPCEWAQVWDTATGETVHRVPAATPYFKCVDLALGRGGKVAVAGRDLQGDEYEPISDWLVNDHTDETFAVAISPDGSTVAHAYATCVRLRDLRTNSVLQEIPVESVRHLAFSHDSASLATTRPGQACEVWNAKTGEKIRIVKGAFGKVAFAPNNVDILSMLGTVRAVSPDAYPRPVTLQGEAFSYDSGAGGDTETGREAAEVFAFLPSGRRIVGHVRRGYGTGSQVVWDSSTGERISDFAKRPQTTTRFLEVVPVGMHRVFGDDRHTTGEGEMAIFDHDGSAIYLQNLMDGPRSGWDVRHPTPPGTLTHFACSPKGDKIAAVAWVSGRKNSRIGSLNIWDLHDTEPNGVAKVFHSVMANGGNVNRVAFSSSGEQVVTVGQLTPPDNRRSGIELHSAASGELIRTMELDLPVTSVPKPVFSRDDRWLATGNVVWDVRTGNPWMRLAASAAICDFSADGRRVITTAGQLYDMSTGVLLLSLPCEGKGMPCFSPDGRRLALPGVVVWDAGSKYPLVTDP